MSDATNPLTTKQYNDINKGLASINEARKLIERGRAAGMDMAEFEEIFDGMENRLKNIKKTFFPERA